MLKHINEHVLQDIEDFIILKGFGKQKRPEALKEVIENDHKQRIDFEKN